MSEKIGVTFGALSLKLHEQLSCSQKTVHFEQRLADAITLLLIHGVLSDAEGHRARKRLLRRIVRALRRTPAPAGG